MMPLAASQAAIAIILLSSRFSIGSQRRASILASVKLISGSKSSIRSARKGYALWPNAVSARRAGIVSEVFLNCANSLHHHLPRADSPEEAPGCAESQPLQCGQDRANCFLALCKVA